MLSVVRESETWVSITRYADIYGVSRPTVYKWLENGNVTVYRVDGVVRLLNQPPHPVNPRQS